MHFLTAPSPLLLSPHLTPFLFPSLFFRPGSTGKLRRFAVLNEPGLLLGSLWGRNCFYKCLCWSCSGFLRRCKDWEVEFSSLESEIFEFMQSSEKPEAFPTKEELVAAGREDLVNAIANEGGWLAFGWDLNNVTSEIHDFEDMSKGKIEGDATTTSSGVGSSSSQPDESMEAKADEDGIEGILNRLEKQRSSSLGVGYREEDSISSENNEDKDVWDHRTTTDAIAAGLGNRSRTSSLSPTSCHPSGSQKKHDQQGSQLGTENLENSLKPEMWRSWIIQRNGFSDADFEDAEIVPNETHKGDMDDASGQAGILDEREFSSELINRERGLSSLDGIANHNDIKFLIQHLESELSSVLHMLRSSADKTTMEMDQKSSDDLSELSDAWEFQENKIMNVQNRLRSIRAKLAVLEGKMALTIMDAQKGVEQKQRKINSAQKALQMLKTTSIVWPNNASEVFLTGSFDGWTTKRKMERLSSSMFSVNLLLYPGRYEIKFIVDGEWKVDPLRPIVTNNGYENNLLIISD